MNVIQQHAAKALFPSDERRVAGICFTVATPTPSDIYRTAAHRLNRTSLERRRRRTISVHCSRCWRGAHVTRQVTRRAGSLAVIAETETRPGQTASSSLRHVVYYHYVTDRLQSRRLKVSCSFRTCHWFHIINRIYFLSSLLHRVEKWETQTARSIIGYFRDAGIMLSSVCLSVRPFCSVCDIVHCG